MSDWDETEPTFAELCDRAAGELPEGWEIKVMLERHAGWVSLFNPDGDELDYPTNSEGIARDFLSALRYATEVDAERPGTQKTA